LAPHTLFLWINSAAMPYMPRSTSHRRNGDGPVLVHEVDTLAGQPSNAMAQVNYGEDPSSFYRGRSPSVVASDVA
jgi:hypothetical protein